MTRTRKPRKKATTDLGRSIMQRERQRLAREQAVLAEKMAEEAARNRRERVAQARINPRDIAHKALQRSVVKRVAGVLASEGVDVPLHVMQIPDDEPIRGWTDFQSINVGYHLYDDPKQTAAVMRGVFYHEGGHCRFTIPFPELEQMVAAETGLTFDDLHGAFDPTQQPFSTTELFKAWNGLEDQRMETATVSDSPRKAGYFVPMVMAELLPEPMQAAMNWPLLVWRRYLPKLVRHGAREGFKGLMAQAGMDPDDMVRRIQGIVARYVNAQSAPAMYQAVKEMAQVYRDGVQVAYDLTDAGHTRQRYSRGDAGDKLSIPIDPSMIEPGDEADGVGVPVPGKGKGKQMPGAGAGRDKGDEDGDGEGAGDGEDGDEGGQMSDGHGGDADKAARMPKMPVHPEGSPEGKHESDDEGYENPYADEDSEDVEQLTQDQIDAIMAEAEKQRMKDPALNGDVQSFVDSVNRPASTLENYVGGVESDPLAIAEANILAENIRRAFEESTADIAPSWHEQQRRGIININRYVTRQPGDVEFFRGYVDEGNPGCDIAVSVLLDYSGSMSRSCPQLAKVAYACKKACEMLDVPCTVVLWDTDARTLWDAAEVAEYVPVIQAQGGTNPAKALDDLDGHRYDKTQHLVLIMTDDAWSGDSPTLATVAQEGRVIFGLGYTDGYRNDAIARSMEDKGADFAFSIVDLDEISKHLQEALAALA